MLRASWNLPPRRRESLYQDPFTTTVSLSCIEGFQVIKHIHWWPEPSSQTLNTGCNCVWRLIFAISGQHLTMYTVYFFAGLHWKVAVTSLIPLYHRGSSWAGAGPRKLIPERHQHFALSISICVYYYIRFTSQP